MRRLIFKPRFTLQNNAKAKNIAKSSIDAEILTGHAQQRISNHKRAIAM